MDASFSPPSLLLHIFQVLHTNLYFSLPLFLSCLSSNLSPSPIFQYWRMLSLIAVLILFLPIFTYSSTASGLTMVRLSCSTLISFTSSLFSYTVSFIFRTKLVGALPKFKYIYNICKCNTSKFMMKNQKVPKWQKWNILLKYHKNIGQLDW